MASLLEQGAELRKSLRSSAFGQAILYSRGSTLSAAITARPNLVEYEIDSGSVGLNFQSMDFVFDVDQAVWSQDSVAFLPEALDRIVYDGKTYEVAAIGSQQHFTYSDHKRLSIRVHTKEGKA